MRAIALENRRLLVNMTKIGFLFVEKGSKKANKKIREYNGFSGRNKVVEMVIVGYRWKL